jgi:hypothetical protein
VPAVLKTAFARLYLARREGGVSRKRFRDELAAASHDRHVGALVSTGAALSTHKAAGRPAALTHEEREVLAGWVLHCNFTDVPGPVHEYSQINVGGIITIATALKFFITAFTDSLRADNFSDTNVSNVRWTFTNRSHTPSFRASTAHRSECRAAARSSTR